MAAEMTLNEVAILSKGRRTHHSTYSATRRSASPRPPLAAAAARASRSTSARRTPSRPTARVRSSTSAFSSSLRSAARSSSSCSACMVPSCVPSSASAEEVVSRGAGCAARRRARDTRVSRVCFVTLERLRAEACTRASSKRAVRTQPRHN